MGQDHPTTVFMEMDQAMVYIRDTAAGTARDRHIGGTREERRTGDGGCREGEGRRKMREERRHNE